MANNRLYIGNRDAKEWVSVEKGWGAVWDGDWFDGEKIKRFLSQVCDPGAQVGQETALFFFNEESPECYDIIKNWEEFK